MEKLMYMMMIEKSKTYHKVTKQVVIEHVENMRKLDDEGKLEICNTEPLVVGGYATYKLVGLQIANRENNYLL
ncbi:hypothetical protein AALA36_03795 [Lachnospiraceae bacterium 66-29]